MSNHQAFFTTSKVGLVATIDVVLVGTRARVALGMINANIEA